MEVEEGDYLLAIDGEFLSADRDPYSALQGRAGTAVTLLVGDEPSEEGAREVRVETLRDDRTQRYRGWIERNRAYVEEKSAGQIGYVYVPDTMPNGQSDLVRQLQGALGKKAILIDERWNSGGQIPTRFVELLSRKATNYWAVRAPSDLPWAARAPRWTQGDVDQRLVRIGGGLPSRRTSARPASASSSAVAPGVALVGIQWQPDPDRRWRHRGAHLRLLRARRDLGHRRARSRAGHRRRGRPRQDGRRGRSAARRGDRASAWQLRNAPARPARPAYPNRAGMGIAEEDK